MRHRSYIKRVRHARESAGQGRAFGARSSGRGQGGQLRRAHSLRVWRRGGRARMRSARDRRRPCFRATSSAGRGGLALAALSSIRVCKLATVWILRLALFRGSLVVQRLLEFCTPSSSGVLVAVPIYSLAPPDVLLPHSVMTPVFSASPSMPALAPPSYDRPRGLTLAGPLRCATLEPQTATHRCAEDQLGLRTGNCYV
jgi:hypothetical protein